MVMVCMPGNGSLAGKRRSCGLLKATSTHSIWMLSGFRPSIRARSIIRDQTRANYLGILWGKNPSDVWDIPNVKHNHPEKTCQFPVGLAERCVLALTNEGDVIFDPYAGVGSSIIAAVNHNRKAIASEKEGRYVDIARERIRLFYEDTLCLRPLG